MNQATLSYGCIVLSAVVHASAMLGAARRPPPPPPALRTELELALPPPPPPKAPAPTPTPEPEPPAPQPKAATRIQPSLPAPPARPLTPEPPPRPELSGNTLLGAGDASFTAPAGNGAERDGPIHTGSAPVVTPPPSLRPAPAAAPAVTTEPLAELSRKPVPPALAASLERNYPPQARSQGKSGEAKVRALIDALGRVGSLTITFESAPEFGAACQKTLLQSQWTPPLGKLGKPTATFITYRCKFRIDD